MAKEIEKTPEKAPLSAEDALLLAEAIRRIDRATREIIAAGLQRKTLVVLLHESSGVAKRDINAVLDSLESLGTTYLEISAREEPQK